MIDIEGALRISRSAYPQGPEKLGDTLGIRIEYSQLRGCGGWCVGSGSRRIIRINSLDVRHRQRFTLAHELSHILLGTATHPTDGGFGGHTDEEATNQIASELLLPADVVTERIGNDAPVGKDEVDSIADDADVSWMVVARKIARLRGDLGLASAYVADFHPDGTLAWMWPRYAVHRITAEKLWARFPDGMSYQIDIPGRGDLLTVLSHVTPYSSSMLVQRSQTASTDQVGVPF